MYIDEDLIERLAQAIHNHYLAEQIRDGAAGDRPSLVAWSELDEDKREANRAQARDITPKLELLGCSIAPADVEGPTFEFTAEELELLARQEQRRWVKQRSSAGWRYGPTRDDAKRVHPSMVEWADLSESERDKDRDAVRNIPSVLAAVQLRAVRPS